MICNPARSSSCRSRTRTCRRPRSVPSWSSPLPTRNGDFIALAVTTVQPREHALELEPAALAEGSLPRRSWVRLDKIFTLGQEAVVKTFGEVTPSFMSRLLDGLCGRIGYRIEAGKPR